MTKDNKRRIEIIEATKELGSKHQDNKIKKRRVAAYARVSTERDEQQHSYEAQISYYQDLIQQRPDWIFVGMYSDEGITGTSLKHRDGFNSMVSDAVNGKIDLIITKSVSRFARNTVDSLSTIRNLKAHGVEVYFEKDNIFTMDSKGELLITMLSSLAQEEARSISENVTWGIRQRFRNGKVSLPYAHFLGYQKGPNDLPEVVPSEAKIIGNIFRWALEGHSASAIAHGLEKRCIPSPAGKKTWRPETVRSILQNEKYMGDAILQKTFCTDFLTKKKKKNEGELPQYHIHNDHPAIVSAEVFDTVQNLLPDRTCKKKDRDIARYPFSHKIICGYCGGFFGSSCNWGILEWRCNSKAVSKTKCNSKKISNSRLENSFAKAVMLSFGSVNELKVEINSAAEKLYSTKELEIQLADVISEIDIFEEALLSKALENQSLAGLRRKITNRRKRADEIQIEIDNRNYAYNRIIEYLDKNISDDHPIYSEQLVRNLLESAHAFRESICFKFRGGTEITIPKAAHSK